MNQNFRKIAKVLLTGYGTILTATTLLLLVLCSLYVAKGSWERSWRSIGVPSYHNSFGDLRVITHSIPCKDAGVDVYIKDACNDYWKQHPEQDAPYQNLLLNYPPIWLKSAHLGAAPGTTNMLGSLIAVAAVLSLWRIFRPRTIAGGLMVVGAVLSPSILLGFERGNIDLVIFSLLVFLIVISEQFSPAFRTLVRSIGVVVLTVLKFFPVACVTLLIRSKRSWFFALAIGAVAVLAAWISADGRFISVLSNTPKTDNLAFGSLPLLIGLSKALGGTGAVSKTMTAAAFFLSAAAFLAVFAPTLVRQLPRPFPRYLPPMQDDLNGCLALAGMSIFCAGFLFGASFDYRLIFLTLALPLLIAAYEAEPSGQRRLWAPLVIVVFLWLSRATDKIGYIDELLDWVIFAAGSAWIASRLLFSERTEN